MPLSRWSNAEIAQRLVALGLVLQIAASTLDRCLASEKIKKGRLKPSLRTKPRQMPDQVEQSLW